MPHQCTSCGRRFPDGSKEMLAGCPDCGGNKFQFAPSLERRASERAGSDPSESSGDEPPDSGDGDPTRRRDSADSRRNGRDRTHPSKWGSDEDRERGGDEDREWEWPESGRRPEDRSADGSADRRAGRSRGGPARRPEDRPDQPFEDSSSPPSEGGSPRRPDRATDDRAGPVESGTGPAESGGSSANEVADADHEDRAQADARSDVVSTDELPPADAADRPDPERGRVVSEPTADKPSLEELREELNQQFESIKIVNPGQYELNLMELYNRDEYIISLQEDGRYVIDVPDSWREGDE